MLDSIDHIKPERGEQDILYELLLKLGLDLCIPIETRNIVGKSVRSIGAGALIACLDENIAREGVEPPGGRNRRVARRAGTRRTTASWFSATAPLTTTLPRPTWRSS